MPVSSRTYERLALEDPEGRWELHNGGLVQKPEMTAEHNTTAWRLLRQLARQLDAGYEARMNAGRARRRPGSYYVPDVFVVPAAHVADLIEGGRAGGRRTACTLSLATLQARSSLPHCLAFASTSHPCLYSCVAPAVASR